MLALVAAWLIASPAGADGNLHALWQVHGKHNTVYLMGSVHVLRPSDYPLAPVLLNAYNDAKALYLELDLAEFDSTTMQLDMLRSAALPEDKRLTDVLGKERYTKAAALAHALGVELPTFDQYAPWFVAEIIEQMQLQKLGFDPASGIDMYFYGKAQEDGKSVSGLESLQEQLSVFTSMPLNTQADYLVSTLEEARDLPKEVDAMMQAWRNGNGDWFVKLFKEEFGKDPAVHQSLLGARNRRWVPKIESLLNDDKNYLVIVGTAHLVGEGSVIELLKKDGIGATQL
jgi:uncharacterized protein YbaP (TraB family)